VVVIDGANYGRAGHSDWYDSGVSITYAYQSPLNVDIGKRYFKTSVDASSPLTVSGATTVTGSYEAHLEDIVLAPAFSTNSVGALHTVTATVADMEKSVVGRNVNFTVVSGPNAGLTGSNLTGSDGQASFTYGSSVTGMDTIEASFVNSQEETVTSNQVTKTWTDVSTPTPTPTPTPGESPTLPDESPRPIPVGGEIVPINTLSVLLSQYSAVIVLLIILSVSLGLVLAKKRKRC
jgi:hypothetical protein